MDLCLRGNRVKHAGPGGRVGSLRQHFGRYAEPCGAPNSCAFWLIFFRDFQICLSYSSMIFHMVSCGNIAGCIRGPADGSIHFGNVRGALWGSDFLCVLGHIPPVFSNFYAFLVYDSASLVYGSLGESTRGPLYGPKHFGGGPGNTRNASGFRIPVSFG